MPGTPGHLVRRFFDVLTAPPLSAAEAAVVGLWLNPLEAEAFFDQRGADQRHGYEAAMSVLAEGIEADVMLRAAALHDIGKRHARLGVVGRSVASVLILLRAPLPARMRLYRDHGELAAEELERIGTTGLVTVFARHHHGRRPADISMATWSVLKRADAPAKPYHIGRSRIS